MKIHIEATPREICRMAGLGNLPEETEVSVEIKEQSAPQAVQDSDVLASYRVLESEADKVMCDAR